MQILLTAAVLAVFFAAEGGATDHAGDTNLRLALVTAGMLLTVLAARIISGLTILQLTSVEYRREPLRRFARLRQLHAVLWLACGAAVYWVLDWPRLVHVDWGLRDAFLLDELLLLAPLLLPLALSWAAFYEVDCVVAKLSGRPAAIGSRARFVAAKFRAEAGLLLAPLLILILYQDSLQTIFAAAAWTKSPLAYSPLLLAILAAFPWFVRWAWRAESLPPGPTRERLEACARRMGVRVNDVLLWPTGGRIANAAVCGFFGGLRYVLLTDELLRRLDLAETEAIFAHELAHAKHRHLPLRLLALFVPFAAAQAASLAMGASSAEHLWLWGTAGAIYVATIYAWYCRRLEYQADRTAAITCSDAAGALTAAGVTTFATALQKAAAGTRQPRLPIMHPTVAARIARLEQAVW